MTDTIEVDKEIVEQLISTILQRYLDEQSENAYRAFIKKVADDGGPFAQEAEKLLYGEE